MALRPRARDLVRSGAYEEITAKLNAQECVILDGGIGTELCDVVTGADELAWGTTALLATPSSVSSVHRRYIDAGCDVISTDTWALATAMAGDQTGGVARRAAHWMDVARQGVRLARHAVTEARRSDQVAVAFTLNSDIDSPVGAETIALIDRVFEHELPDLILVETLTLLRPTLFAAVESLLAIGLPVWLSFRRCREGPCGVYGQHWGGPEGDAFGRAAATFEAMGVGALLVNCVPPDHVAGMVSDLRPFTDLPLGVYPNLGYLTSTGWRFDREVGSAEYAELAQQWRREGAQIVGGCCGVGPSHVAAAQRALAGTRPGRAGRARKPAPTPPTPAAPLAPWKDDGERLLFPLPVPDISCEPGVAAPTQASLLLWRHLFAGRIGAGARCLDVGCGSGLQAIQLALNRAAHVDAIDPDPRAVPNTIANAYRNGVGDIVSATVADLYPWNADEPYDVVVANLIQRPVHPDQLVATHRPLDFWGRGLLDHLMVRLPEILAAGGVAYVVQLSVVGMQRTLDLLAEGGLHSGVVDVGFVELDGDNREQIAEVEALSDAYHLRLGRLEVMVAYLLEIRRPPTR